MIEKTKTTLFYAIFILAGCLIGVGLYMLNTGQTFAAYYFAAAFLTLLAMAYMALTIIGIIRTGKINPNDW